MIDSHFITRGQIPTDQPALYVQRVSDTQFDDYLRRSDYIAVIGPRVSGKTSLLARKHLELQSRQRYLPVYINLSLLTKLAGSNWYQRLHNSIIMGLRSIVPPIPGAILATDELTLRDALLDLLENQVKGRVLVIILDDVETIPKPILTPLMAMIREIFSSREMIAAFKRCVFVLSGCFLPDDLIVDPSISPFRVAERIHMSDAPLEGVQQLVDLLAKPNRPVIPKLAEQVFHWTEGDVYLTQRLCALLDQYSILTPSSVDQLATHRLTEDDIFEGVLRYVEKKPATLNLLRRIQSHEPLRFSRLQRDIADAWLAGIIKETSDGNCALRNPVYESVLHTTDPGNLRPPLPPGVLPNYDAISTDPLFTPGRVILQKRYRIDDSIGEGGMAQVFRAKDLSTNMIVAVKRLQIRLSENPTILERFRREGESLRQLRHPHIVRFIDLFVEADHHYIVMEYVPGGNLSQLMHREGRSLSIPKVVKIVLGLTEALDHAHKAKIIHRDIKPGNVLLTPDLTPRLADFGIARMIAQLPLTEVDMVIGTLAYMSPEVCRAEVVNGQSDLWSLGVMTFEMLTGFLPFDKPDPASIINAILNMPIPNIRDSRPDIPPALANVIGKMLTRDLRERYPTAHAVSRDLRAFTTRM